MLNRRQFNSLAGASLGSLLTRQLWAEQARATAIGYLGPKVFRVLKTRLWLVWRKLNAPASDKANGGLTASLPAAHDMLERADRSRV